MAAQENDDTPNWPCKSLSTSYISEDIFIDQMCWFRRESEFELTEWSQLHVSSKFFAYWITLLHSFNFAIKSPQSASCIISLFCLGKLAHEFWSSGILSFYGCYKQVWADQNLSWVVFKCKLPRSVKLKIVNSSDGQIMCLEGSWAGIQTLPTHKPPELEENLCV